MFTSDRNIHFLFLHHSNLQGMPDAVTLKPILKLAGINHVGISSCMPVGSPLDGNPLIDKH